eukprot:9772963-Prorocentrum_lima.AAC.1
MSKEGGGLLRKGPRVRLRIWGSWLEVCQAWDNVSRALIMVYVGLKLGYLTAGDAAMLNVSRPRLVEPSKS